MAQTIWLHKLADELKARSEGMDYVCEHVFQEFESGSVKERFPLPNATAKDGSTYRALVCGLVRRTAIAAGTSSWPKRWCTPELSGS